MTPTLHKITRQAGVAGQVSVTAEVQYEGEAVETVTFVGSVYGGPVVMITPEGNQFFVTDADRFGEFGPEWVRKFFA